MPTLSVIIPLAPSETAWQALLPSLDQLPDRTEILFVTGESDTQKLEDIHLDEKTIRLIHSPRAGRAPQMNIGAQEATGDYLWFIHADTQFSSQVWPQLQKILSTEPQTLLYFDLGFLKDATSLMLVNSWGVQFRSRILNVPFGDQGFCISQTLFKEIGGYPEHEPYGEDHVFVWLARLHGIKLQPVGTKLLTSARKYRKQGWLQTTYLHQVLWVKQAWPYWRQLQHQRFLKLFHNRMIQ